MSQQPKIVANLPKKDKKDPIKLVIPEIFFTKFSKDTDR